MRFNKNPVPKGAGFFAVWVCLPGGAALTGATDSHPPCTTCSPDKVRSTASGEVPV
ncbi:hypothetical protein NUKP38_32780 [Klebsiella variicola]|nr:hypothetical protein NUKP38_32780 [Klebsiella variicola]